LGRFANAARRSAFFWSFRSSEVFPAFLVGWIITLSPFYGLHTLLGIFCAFIFRANILVVLALQLISNPFAEPFILFICYKTGKLVSGIFCNAPASASAALDAGSLGSMGKNLGQWIALATLGSILLGYVFALISCAIYKYAAWRMGPAKKKKQRSSSDGMAGGCM
jgi:uncharacterized protein (DUF2062 family)